MAAPKWFDSKLYLNNKLDQLHDELGYPVTYSVLDLKADFTRAGYDTDEDGLYKHFVDFGESENVSPNKYFDADYYFQAKAADYFHKAEPAAIRMSKVTDAEIQFIKQAFSNAGLSAWEHYFKYGMKEGIDPNVNFNTNQYLDDKLAKLKSDDPDTYGSWERADVIQAFKDAGVNPVEHYMRWGVDEDLIPKHGSHASALKEISSSKYNVTGTVGDASVDDDGVLTWDNDYNDYFNAELDQLTSSHIIDGYGGSDTLYARLSAGSEAGSLAGSVEPTVNNVETVLFRSQIGSGDSQTNKAPVSATVDADRIYLEDGKTLTIGSDNSRANLAIEDIRHNSSETVIRFADADPEVSFYVYFDPQHLKAMAAETSGTLNLELMDVKNAQHHSQPLTEQPFDEFIFKWSGQTDYITFDLSVSDKGNYTGESATYQSLLTAFQEALADFEAKNPDLKDVFKVSLGDTYIGRAVVGSDSYEWPNGRYITITSTTGTVSADPDDYPGTGWGVSTGIVPAKGGIVWGVEDAESISCPLIEVTVELDNVGRVQWEDAYPNCLPNDILKGSNAGDLQIGSMSMRSGIERMDVKVDEGSWLAGLYSTNNTLRMVTVEAKDINGDGLVGTTIAAHLNQNASNTDTVDGALYIGTWNGKLDDQGNPYTNMTWTDPARLLSADQDPREGLHDVAVFDATLFGVYEGDINIAATITDASYDKYLKGVDPYELGTDGNPVKNAPMAAYDDAFTYLTGSGNDTVNMTVAGDIAADVDFKLNINTNAGSDLVAFRYGTFVRNAKDAYIVTDHLSENQNEIQKYMQNVHINTDADDDAIYFYGGIVDGSGSVQNLGGSVDIDAGAGKDAIYANQVDLTTGGAGSGVTFGPDAYNAVWVFNATTANSNDAVADRAIGVEGFDGATLNNNVGSGWATFNKGDQGHDQIRAVVTFQGITAEGKISDLSTATKAVSAEDLNHAVIKAINDNDILGKLLFAKDAADHSLIVESLVNNEFNAKDLTITFYSGTGNTFNSSISTNKLYDTEDGLAGFGTYKDVKVDEDEDEENLLTVDGTDGETLKEYTGFDMNKTFEAPVNPSQAIIDAGADNDVIALSHNGLRDVIELTGSFGKDTILGFEPVDSNSAVTATPVTPEYDVINTYGLAKKAFHIYNDGNEVKNLSGVTSEGYWCVYRGQQTIDGAKVGNTYDFVYHNGTSITTNYGTLAFAEEHDELSLTEDNLVCDATSYLVTEDDILLKLPEA